MKESTKLKKKYSERPDAVREYMNDLVDQLIIDYGEVNPSWEASLDLIADWYSIYVLAKQSISELGLTSVNSKTGVISRNPAFTAMSTASTHMQQLLGQFAANPYQKSKLKSLDKDVRNETDYLKSILEN